MNNFEKETGMESFSSFRGLVGHLVENSDLFPVKKVGEEQMSILDAIEKNEITLYVPERASDKMLDAVHCLISIHEELEKEEPDQNFIESTVERLKEYL